ncbi:MAG: type II toxin-antitoxin system VapC family toxin [Micromonosporaceae bacterium]
MIYLDSSAVVKLVRREAETHALRAWLAANPQPLVASALARTETTRALRCVEPTALPVLASVLALLHQVPLSDPILDSAAALADRALRSLDAIHIATAASLGAGVSWFVAYDRRLAQAAQTEGLAVVSPS